MAETDETEGKTAQRAALAGAAAVLVAAGLWAGVSSGPEPVSAEPVAAPITEDEQLAGILPRISGEVVRVQSEQVPAAAADTAPPKRSPTYSYIVRFAGVDAADECVKMYRRDPVQATAIFRSWADDIPELKGFEITGATYSGEAILTWTPESPDQSGRHYADEAHKRLLALEAVRYADLDAIAFAEEE